MQGTAAVSDDADAYLVKKSLKFTHATADKLRRKGQSGNRKTNTLSYWIKNTGDGTVNVITGGGWDGGNRWHSGIGSDGKFYRYERIGSSDKIEFTGTRILRDPGAWMHIVEVIDTSHATAAERFRLYINGKQETLSYTTTYGHELDTLRDSGNGFNIGGRFDMSGDHFEGVIADVQYIDGIAVGPGAFGSFDDSNCWNPKGFSIPAPNTGATWSGMISGTQLSGSEFIKGFDGNLSTGMESNTDTYSTFTPTDPIVANSEIRIFIYMRGNAPSTNYDLIVNGVSEFMDAHTVTGTNSSAWYTLKSRTLTSLRFGEDNNSAKWMRIYAIEVDGVVLIDGYTDPTTRNNKNDGTKWSTGSVTGAIYSGYPWSKCFDGALSSNDGTSGDTGVTTVLTLPKAQTGLIDIYLQGNANAIQVNGSSQATTGAVKDTRTDCWKLHLGQMTLTSIGVGSSNELRGIAVDGHLLIDGAADTSFKFDFDSPTTKNTIDPDVTTGYDGPNPSILQGDGTASTDPNSAYLMAAWAGNGGNYGDPLLKDWSPNASDFTKVGTVASNGTAGNLHFYDRVGEFASGDAVLRSATDSDFGPGTGKFTWELWFMLKKSLYTHGNDVYIVDMRDGTTNGHAGYASVSYLNSGAGPTNSLILGASGSSNQGNHAAINENQWYHLACVREGTGSNETKFYLDGTFYYAVTEAKDSDLEWFVVGNVNSYASYDYGFPGYIEDFRYYKGIAKYTSDFQVPARNDWIPTKVASSTAKAELILFNNSVSNLTDDKSGKVTVTNVGSLSTTSAPTNSHGITTVANFTGTQRLTTNFQNIVGGGAPSTIDVWWDHGAAQNNTQPSGSAIIMAENTSDSFIEINGSGSASTTVYLYGAQAVDLGAYEWGHCRVTWDGTNSTLYWNGVQKYQGTASNATGAFTIGAGSAGAAPFNGKIGPGIITRGDLGPPPPGGLVLNSGELTVNDDKTIVIPSETCLVDSPVSTGTDSGKGGEISGNYATWNPLFNSDFTYSEGNLKVVTESGNGHCRSTIGMNSGGKYYSEFIWVSGGDGMLFGVVAEAQSKDHNIGQGTNGWGYYSAGSFQTNSSDSGSPASFANGDHIGVALDLSAGGSNNGVITFYKNGASQGAAFSNLDCTKTYFFACNDGSSSGTGTSTGNFGQKPFKYDGPAGYKTLCNSNLDNTFTGAALNNPSKYFDAKIWRGRGDSTTKTFGDLSFQPDLLWFKRRDSTVSGPIYDAIRGTSNALRSDVNNAQAAFGNAVVTPTSAGFTITGSNTSGLNGSGEKMVGWFWDAGTAATTPSSSYDITPAAQWVTATAGFSITKYEGNGSADQQIPHGQAVKPEFAVIKKITDSGNGGSWMTKHVSLPANNIISWDNPEAANADSMWYGIFKDHPDQATVKVSTNSDSRHTNESGVDYIMYCWAPIKGFSHFGSYTGNDTTNGPFVYTGFKPRWIMIKNSTAGGSSYAKNWHIYDTARNPYNIADKVIFADVNTGGNTYDASSDQRPIDILSNGFKIRESDSNINTVITYIFAAFAEHPFKTSRAN